MKQVKEVRHAIAERLANKVCDLVVRAGLARAQSGLSAQQRMNTWLLENEV